MTEEEAAAGDVFEVWPDNVRTANVFKAMTTQWNVGPRGAIGLNYGVLDYVMKRYGVRSVKEKDAMFHEIRIMEDAALEQLSKNKS